MAFATKVWSASADEARGQICASLGFFGGRVDLYQVHNPTIEELEREEIQEAMEMLQDAGKVRFWGVSVTTPEEGLEVVRRGWGHALQVLYNVLNQVIYDERQYENNPTNPLFGTIDRTVVRQSNFPRYGQLGIKLLF